MHLDSFSMNNVYRVFLLIISFFLLNVSAQENEKNAFELLQLEFEILSSYNELSENIENLVASAAEYEKQGDYDFAVVFLEEAISELKTQKQEQTIPQEPLTHNFFGNIIAGIDYNRQEFELGFSESDSVLLDELSKPFVGFELRYLSDNKLFNVENSFRYDSENLQSELFFNNKFLNQKNIFEMSYGGIYDRNFKYDDLGYFEVYTDINLKSSYKNSDWYWSLKNYSRFKSFKESSESISDYFRNSFTAYLIKNYSFYNNLQMDYTFDYNESIKFDNNDFYEHNGGLAFQDVYFNKFKIKISSRYRYYNFNYLISDSAFANSSGTISLNPDMVYEFNSFFSLDINYDVDIKKFNVKTEQEPDYTYNYINPSLVINIGDLTSVSFGYIYEKKIHKLQDELVEQYIKDQDYNSSGFSSGIDYSSYNGVLVSLNVEYTRRRYPNYSSDVDFNIYSNRNILNLLLYAQIPLYKNITLNAIGSYDNDKDIDSDFNDTISSFYTLELSYTF